MLLDENGGHTLRNDTQLLGSTPREVDDTSTYKRAAVSYPNHHATTVGWIVHLQFRTKRIGAMGTCQTIGMQSFATGGLPANELLGIERRLTLLRTLRQTLNVER